MVSLPSVYGVVRASSRLRPESVACALRAIRAIMVVEYIKDIGTARFCVFGRLLFRFVRANEKKVSVGERRRNGAGTDVFCEAFYF